MGTFPCKSLGLCKRFWRFIPKALGEHRRQDVQAKSLYENSFSLIPLDVACVGQKHNLSELRTAVLGLQVGQGSTRLSWGGSKRWNKQPPRLAWAVMYMPLILPFIVPYIIRHITPFQEFRL